MIRQARRWEISTTADETAAECGMSDGGEAMQRQPGLDGVNVEILGDKTNEPASAWPSGSRP